MAATSKHPDPANRRSLALDGRRILIAEDDFLIASELSLVCRDCGPEVIGPYATGLEALEGVRDMEPDLALLDICLRDGDSFDAARKAVERGVAIIFLTGYDCDTAIPDDLASETCLEKPFDHQDLVRAVGRGLEVAEVRR